MATAMPSLMTEPAPAPLESNSKSADQHFRWFNLGWEGYLALLEARRGESRPRIIYLDGDAQLVTTSNIHECMVDRLTMFVREVVVGLDIPCVATRETNFKRQDQDAGVEPDDSFYLANYRSISAKFGEGKIDMDVDPPPDLALEIEYGNPAKHAVEILRRLGVPEVWVRKQNGLRFLVLGEDGQYAEFETSLSFPFLGVAEVFEWVERPGMDSSTQWVKELRRWVQDVLVPRVRGRQG
jgi:Uma2 family endonuclease